MHTQNHAKRSRLLNRLLYHGGVFTDKVLDFSVNLNPLGPPRKVVEALKLSLAKLAYYPSPSLDGLREAASSYMNVSPNEVVVGAGCSDLIHLFSEALVKPGGRVLLIQPSFSEYERAVVKVGALVRWLKLKKPFTLTFDKLYTKLKGVEALYICNPDNPTGRLLERRKLLELVEVCERLGVKVFVDESYIELSQPEESLAEDAPGFSNLVVARSFSKAFSLPGIRLGYASCHTKLAKLLLSFRRPWPVPSLAEDALRSALGCSQKYLREARRVVAEERAFLLEGLRRLGFEPLDGRASFILVGLDGLGVGGRELKRMLLSRGILVRDCRGFRGLGDRFVRVCVRLREENLRLLGELRCVLS